MARGEQTVSVEPKPTGTTRTVLARLDATLSMARARYPTWAVVLWAIAVFGVLMWVHTPNDTLRELHFRHQEMLGALRKLLSPYDEPSNVAIVEITDATARAVGSPWPFPSDTLATLVKKIEAKEAAVIVPYLVDEKGELLRFPADSTFAKALEASKRAVVPLRPDGSSIFTGGAAPSVLDQGPGRPRERFGLTREVEVVALGGGNPVSWHVKALYHREARRQKVAHVEINPERTASTIEFRNTTASRYGSATLNEGHFLVDPLQVPQLPRQDAREILNDQEAPDSLKNRIVILGVATRKTPRIRVAPNLQIPESQLHALVLANLDTDHLLFIVHWFLNYILLLTALAYGIETALAPRDKITFMILQQSALVVVLPFLFLSLVNVEIDYVRPAASFVACFLITLLLRRTERNVIQIAAASTLDLGHRGDNYSMSGEGRNIGEDVLEHLATRYLGDRFKLLGHLGTGGMGSVFRAYSQDMRAEVALKLLHPQYAGSTEMVKRFYREFDIQSRLNHPGFVRVFEKGEGALPWFSMQILRGEPLDIVMEQRGRLDPEVALHIFRKVAEAMAYAHGRGIFHRDLKPGNIMTTDGPEVLVLDMGLARWENASTLTSDGKIMGTIRYMAPEQMAGGEIDSRSDIFSLVVILHEMLSGKLPYPPLDPKREVKGLPNPLQEYHPKIPVTLDALILRCLSFEPAARPPTLNAILEELDGIMPPKS